MKLNSNSFDDGAPIPGEFAFAIQDPNTHISLSKDRNPHLMWRDIPEEIKSFVLICHDPDVPSRADDVNKEGREIAASLPRVTFFHWLLLDIPAGMREISAGSHSNSIVPRGKSGPVAPNGLRHGLNDYTNWFADDKEMAGNYYGYDGPGPPWNDALLHRYVFTLYALDVPHLDVRGALTGENIKTALASHVLAEDSLTGRHLLAQSKDSAAINRMLIKEKPPGTAGHVHDAQGHDRRRAARVSESLNAGPRAWMRRREFSILLGGAATASTLSPSPPRAQQKATPAIGYLGTTTLSLFAPSVAALRQGLSETGYVEGQNLTIEYRWAEGRYDRLPALATDLVGRKVDVIVAGSPPAAHAAKGATSTIPIVFFGGDAVGEGLVGSLARPGGNLTGVSFLTAELNAKRFELLSELVSLAKVITLLVNPNNPDVEGVIRAVQEAAQAKGVQLHILKASTESEIDAAFASLVQRHAGALVVSADPFLFSLREQIVALAARHAVPAIYQGREFATAGGLISYGASLTVVHRKLGIYAGKILKGAKLADLPVVQPTKFELVINLKTAKALGLTIPPSTLARADEVIE